MPTRRRVPVALLSMLEIDHRPKGTAFGTRWAPVLALAPPRRLGGLGSSGGSGGEGASCGGGSAVLPPTLSA